MSRGASKSKQLGKGIKRPRVQIEYDVEVNGALEKKELAFVVGILGDFAGDSKDQLPDLADRRFVSIHEENFDEVMRRLKPSLDIKVENTLAGDGSEMALHLEFNSMEDFSPGRIVEQVEPLRKLMETRNKLRDLQTNADKKVQLEKELEAILSNTAQRDRLASELGLSGANGGAAEPGPGTGESQ